MHIKKKKKNKSEPLVLTNFAAQDLSYILLLLSYIARKIIRDTKLVDEYASEPEKSELLITLR